MTGQAISQIQDMPPHEQRKHLSEMVRVAELRWIDLTDKADRLEDGKSLLLSEMKNNLRGGGAAKSSAEAEDMARGSPQYKAYVARMHDGRKEANEARAEWNALSRDYWLATGLEANERQQMRMAR